jgi:uncharacterized membrane protein
MSFFATDWRGDRLSYFPANEEEMEHFDAVVMADVSAAALRGNGEKLLKDFIAAGGGLVVFGGFYAYAGGKFNGTVLEEILPVTWGGAFEVQRLPQPGRLAEHDRLTGFPSWSMKADSMVFWLHKLTPKPESKIVLEARTGWRQRQPFLVAGRFQQGRVVAVAGTVYGQEAPGKTGFWNQPEWPSYLSAVLLWTCGGE